MDLVEGGSLAVSSWEILDRSVKPGEVVLVYDDNGGQAGPSWPNIWRRAEAGSNW